MDTGIKKIVIVSVVLFVLAISFTKGYEEEEITPDVKVDTEHNELVEEIKGSEYEYKAYTGFEYFDIIISIPNTYSFTIEFYDVVIKYGIQKPGETKEDIYWRKITPDLIRITPGAVPHSEVIGIEEKYLEKGQNNIFLKIESKNFEKDRTRISIEPELNPISVNYMSVPTPPGPEPSFWGKVGNWITENPYKTFMGVVALAGVILTYLHFRGE